MKKILAIIASASLLCGCTTTPQQTQIEQLAADLRDITEATVIIALAEKPDNRDELLLVLGKLKALEALPDPITLTSLRSLLMELPLDRLESDKGQLYIIGARVILRRVSYEVDLGTLTTVRPIVVALREGLEAGLK